MNIVIATLLAVNLFAGCDELSRRAKAANAKYDAGRDTDDDSYIGRAGSRAPEEAPRCELLDGDYRVEPEPLDIEPSSCSAITWRPFTLRFDHGDPVSSKCRAVPMDCAVALDCELEELETEGTRNWWARAEYLYYQTTDVRGGTGEAHLWYASDRGTCGYRYKLHLTPEK
jgi:hypothetical protein